MKSGNKIIAQFQSPSLFIPQYNSHLKMSYKFTILVILIFFLNIGVALSQAANDESAVLTLDECLTYAFENNDSIKNSILEQQIAKAQVGEIRSAGLPQINGSFSLSKNYIVPTTLMPAIIIPEEFRDPSIGPEDFVPVQFSTPYTGNASVTWEQLIFDGSYFVGLKAANTYKELSSKAAIKTKIDVAGAVTKAYYAALIAQERIVLADENFRRLDTLLRDTKIMYENGFAEKIEVSRINVQYNNAKVDREKAIRSVQLAFYLLKFQMGMPIEQLVYLEEDIEDVQIAFNESALNEFEYSDRIEYSQLETSRNLAELDLKNNQVQYFPRLSAFVNLGANMGTNSSNEIFDFSNNWFESGAVGATLTLPIFDGLRKSYKIQQSRLTIAQLNNSFNTLENAIDLSIVQSRINLNNSMETLDSYEENMELAKEVSDVAKIKYQEGVGSNIEVVDAEIAYQQAESNYFNALYDALVAKTDLQTALGTLIK